MHLSRLVSAAAVAALISGAAYAQTSAPATTVEPAAAPVAAATPVVDAAATPATPVAAPAPAAPAFTPVAPAGDVVATLKASGEFTTFLKALDATNLTNVVKTTPTLTVFAPTDAAFAALPAGEVDRLLKPDNAAELQRLLVYHLVNAPIDEAKIKGAKGPIQTVAGTELLLDGSTAPYKANSAEVLQANVKTSGGVIYVVDRVLSPTDPAIAAGKAAIEAAKAEAAAAETPAG